MVPDTGADARARGGRSRGAETRQGNGLTAVDWVRVARPEPDVAAELLESLRRTGIAAFIDAPAADARPPADGGGSTADHEPDATFVSDAADAADTAFVSEANGTGDRVELWVDATDLDDVATVLAAVVRHGRHDADAVGVVDEEETTLGDIDLQALVEDALEDGGDGSRGSGRSTRNPTPSARPYPRPSRPSRPGRGDLGDTPIPYIDRDRRLPDIEHDDLNDDGEFHFQPEEPPALRGTLSRTTVWALVIFGIGVIALAMSGLAPSLFFGYAPLASLLGTAAVLVGVGMLVTRLRDGRRDGDDHGGPNGDGAIL